MYIPRLRYIKDAVKEIKSMDKDCPVTYNLIHSLIQQNKITKIKYGSAWLVNLDELFAFFNGESK